MLAIALLAGGGAGRASTDAIRATKDAAALPTWENLYDWAGGHGYVGWHTSTSSTSDYGLAPALGGQPGVWLWPKGGQHVYTPGDYAEWTYTAPGTTRLERTSLSFSYRNKLLAHHCIEIGFRTLVAAAARPESPSTLVAFSGVARSFDADAGRVAWIDSAWVLHVRSVRSDAETTIRYTNPYQEIPSLATGPPLVLEPRQLLWLSTRGVAGFEDADRAYVAPVGATRGRRLTNLVHSEGGAGGYVTGLAGDGSAFAYGIVTVNEIQTNGSVYQVSGGGVWTLAGTIRRRLTGVPPAIVLAEAAGRVAIAPVDTGERQDGTPAGAGTVEVRNAATGALVSSVMPTGPIRAAALTPTILAVLAGSQIARYDVASGKLLGSTQVPADTAAQLDAAGELIAFRRSRSVGVVNSTSGRISKMVATSWAPTGVALDGRTLAWAERRRVAPGAVSKKTFTAQIRTLTLPS